MATKLQVTIKDVGGNPFNADSVRLRDSANAYGIQIINGGTLLVASDIDFPNTGTGTYEYDFSTATGYKARLAYEFAIQVTIGSRIYYALGYIPVQAGAIAPTDPAAMDDYRMSLSELVDYTAVLLADPDKMRYPREAIVEELNNAMVEFAVETKLVKDRVAMTTAVGMYIYNAKQAALVAAKREFVYPTRIEVDSMAARSLYPESQHTLDKFWGGLFKSALWSFGFDEVGPGRFSLRGVPTEALDLDIEYVAMPAYIDLDEEYPDSLIPSLFHGLLPYGAARNLLFEEMDTKLIGKALEYDKRFNSELTRAAWDALNMGTDVGVQPL